MIVLESLYCALALVQIGGAAWRDCTYFERMRENLEGYSDVRGSSARWMRCCRMRMVIVCDRLHAFITKMRNEGEE